MAKSQPRIYEYLTQEGVVVWSFTKLPNLITHSQKLILDTREGVPLTQYIADLRGLGRVLGLPEPEEP